MCRAAGGELEQIQLLLEPTRKAAIPYGGTPPTADHPWKQRYDEMQTPGSSRRRPGRTETALAIPSSTP